MATSRLTDAEIDELIRRIKAARAYAKLSVSGLAEALGVSESTIKRWESGNFGERPRARLQSIAEDIASATNPPFRIWPDEKEAQEPVSRRELDSLERRVRVLEARFIPPTEGQLADVAEELEGEEIEGEDGEDEQIV